MIQPKSNKTKMIISAVVVVLIIAAAATTAYFCLRSGEPKSPQKQPDARANTVDAAKDHKSEPNSPQKQPDARADKVNLANDHKSESSSDLKSLLMQRNAPAYYKAEVDDCRDFLKMVKAHKAHKADHRPKVAECSDFLVFTLAKAANMGELERVNNLIQSMKVAQGDINRPLKINGMSMTTLELINAVAADRLSVDFIFPNVLYVKYADLANVMTVLEANGATA
jgi:hypothetical protein